MNYFIKRDDKDYGPYTLADLQRYVQEGSISPSDLTRNEGMTDWKPVSQVIGNVAVPASQPQHVFGAAGPGQPSQANMPPGLHWGTLLGLGIITCSIFGIIWAFVQAAYARKLRPNSKALLYFALYVALAVVGGVLEVQHQTEVGVVFRIAAIILFQCGNFSMKNSFEEYYNTEEPVGLHLSGVMSFFFSLYYYQYHLNRISDWKKTGVLRT